MILSYPVPCGVTCQLGDPLQRALIDNGLKIDLIDSRVVKRLGLKEEIREESIRATIVDDLLM